jgi:hypothetical protein
MVAASDRCQITRIYAAITEIAYDFLVVPPEDQRKTEYAEYWRALDLRESVLRGAVDAAAYGVQRHSESTSQICRPPSKEPGCRGLGRRCGVTRYEPPRCVSLVTIAARSAFEGGASVS